jgi:hypothetical protein
MFLCLQGAGIVPFVRHEAVSQHVGMSLEIEPSGLSGALHHAAKAGGAGARPRLAIHPGGRQGDPKKAT